MQQSATVENRRPRIAQSGQRDAPLAGKLIICPKMSSERWQSAGGEIIGSNSNLYVVQRQIEEVGRLGI